MKHSFRLPAIFGAIVMSALTALTSCTYGSQGIFYGLEHETKITTGTAFGSSSPYVSMHSMVQYSYGTNTYYLVTGGAGLFYETPSADNWQQVSMPGSRVASIAELTSGTTNLLYAIVGNDSNDNTLYATTGDFKGTWTPVTVTNGETPINLVPILASDVKTVLGYILVTINSSQSYENFYILQPSTTVPGNTGTDFSLLASVSPSVIPAGDGIGNPILNASCDQLSLTASANLYLMSGSFVWTSPLSTTTGLPTVFTSIANLPTHQIWGVMTYVGASGPGGLNQAGLLLGDAEQGNLYFGTVTGGSWNQISQLASSARNSYSMIFHFQGVGVSGLGNAIFVGSAKSGLGQIQGGTFTAPPNSNTVDTNSWASSLLEQYGIQMFFTGTNGDLFLGTYGFGLWLQKTDGTFQLQ